MRRLAPVLLLIAAVGVSACRSTGGESRQVVATTTQVADMTRAVAGKATAVKQILKPNADPHEYEPRPSDAEAVASAKLGIRPGGDGGEGLNGVIRPAGGNASVVPPHDSARE